jgi:hypothetical protein
MVSQDVLDVPLQTNKRCDQQRGNGSVKTGLKIIGTALRESAEEHDMKQLRGQESHTYLILKNRPDVNGYLRRTRKTAKIYLHFIVGSSIFDPSGMGGTPRHLGHHADYLVTFKQCGHAGSIIPPPRDFPK